MKITISNPETAPAPVGPYSQVARLDVGDGTLLMVSGQLALDAQGKLVGEGSMTQQAERVFETIGAILDAHGASFADVVNIRTYLTDLSRFSEYLTVREAYLTGRPPTSTTLGVSGLVRPGALVEIEVMAAMPGEPG